MVAIHIPRPAPEELAPERPVFRPVAPGTRRPRPLTDRSTRIRRRRLAVLVAIVGAVLLVALTIQLVSGLARVDGSSRPEPVDRGPAPVAGQTYVVQPGDTLWSIAAEIAPDDDPRVVVDALRAANGGPALEVGTRLDLDLD